MNDTDILRKSLDKAFAHIATLATALTKAQGDIKDLHGRLDAHNARHAGHAARFNRSDDRHELSEKRLAEHDSRIGKCERSLAGKSEPAPMRRYTASQEREMRKQFAGAVRSGVL